MSASASNATKFYSEVAKNRKAWTVRDEKGFPVSDTSSGQKAMPFWSSLRRAERVIALSPSWRQFEVVELSWEEIQAWFNLLEDEGELVGLNWSGQYARGYSLEPYRVRRAIDYYLSKEDEENVTKDAL